MKYLNTIWIAVLAIWLGGCEFQSNAFAPNISATWGYIFPQERNKRRLRIGLNYYNGRALSNQFQNRKEKFIAFFVALDV